MVYEGWLAYWRIYILVQ